MTKCMLISLDMLLALPIAAAAISLLMYSVNINAYIAGSAGHMATELRLYDASQSLILALNGSMGYTAYVGALHGLSKSIGINASMAVLEGFSCRERCACRIVVVNGSAYALLVC